MAKRRHFFNKKFAPSNERILMNIEGELRV